MRTLIDAALHHSRTTLSALLLILIAGTVAYVEIPKEADPDVNIPIIYVLLRHEGISPEDAERLLLRPVEQEVDRKEHTSELQSLMRISYAVFCLKKKHHQSISTQRHT